MWNPALSDPRGSVASSMLLCASESGFLFHWGWKLLFYPSHGGSPRWNGINQTNQLPVGRSNCWFLRNLAEAPRLTPLKGNRYSIHTIVYVQHIVYIQQNMTKAHIVIAMLFLVVMYGCESWTMKAECWRTDAFELWYWRRLLKVPWTAKRSNQSIL